MFKNIIEILFLKLRKKYIKKTSWKRKKKLKNYDFTIISNNCWGGLIYQSYGLKYNTPTIGCYFMSDDYIKFISNIHNYINQNLCFIDPKTSKWYSNVKDYKNYGKYPVGRLGDIEIFFMHYSSEQEALNKWNKRKKRINYNNILFKFSEMNNCNKKNIEQFQNLKLNNKICFISKKYKQMENSYTVVVSKKNVTITKEPFGNSTKINITKLLNTLK